MIQHVASYMARQGMPPPESHLLVGVSGGVDSMVLLDVLLQLGYRCEVAHVDHGLRGASSDADRELVVQHCAHLGIPCHVRQVEVAALRARPGISTQMAARRLRLSALKELAESIGAKDVALAHHADDAVETLFLHLLRGMGTRGWGTIPPRTGVFVRPLLEISRAEILAHAADQGIPFREDASNADPTYLRSRVRHELLPVLEQMRPGAAQVLRRDVALLRSIAGLAQEALEERIAGADLLVGIPRSTLADRKDGLLLLRYLLDGLVVHPAVIEDLWQAMNERGSTARFQCVDGWLELTPELLRVEPDGAHLELHEATVEEDLVVRGGAIEVAEVQVGDMALRSGETVAWMDRDALQWPLRLRAAKAADHLVPMGMTGRKRVFDLLADRKVPRALRSCTHVLCDAQGEVVWVVGHRLSDRVKVHPGTRRILRVTWVAQGAEVA